MPTQPSLRDRLADGPPLLADGAMGTLLIARGGMAPNACLEALNTSQPHLVEGVHRDYLLAGADVIETNTFGANAARLAAYGLAAQVVALNRAAVMLAQRALAKTGRTDSAYIVGSIGPTGVGVRPFGKLAEEEARAIFTEQIAALADVGVDGLMFETFTDHHELLIALEAARAVAPGLPTIAQMTFGDDDRTALGWLPGRVADALHRAGADVVGVNCSVGPSQLARVLHAMRASVPGARYSAVPNAGLPESVGGRFLYRTGPAYFADAARTLVAEGARLVGGCCGTTPEHIAATRAAFDAPGAFDSAPRISLITPEPDGDAPGAERPSELATRLARGQFTVTVEVAPPRSYALDGLVRSGELLRDAGAHLLDVADTPAAKMRMSPWAVAQVLQARVGLESVLHFPTRGRNVLRVQGDLLAAHAIGVRNLFVTMGDPARIGDYPDATDTFDLAPTKLIALVAQQMNHGTDLAGNSIGRPTAYTVGCALNMAADDLDKEIALMQKKLDAGAHFALGQAVFDPAPIEAFHRRWEQVTGAPFTLPVLLGIMPLLGLKQAHYLHHEVPGITIPQHVFAALEAAGDDAPQAGVRLAQALLRDVRGMVAGAYIIPALGRYDLAAEVVDSVAVPST